MALAETDFSADEDQTQCLQFSTQTEMNKDVQHLLMCIHTYISIEHPVINSSRNFKQIPEKAHLTTPCTLIFSHSTLFSCCKWPATTSSQSIL